MHKLLKRTAQSMLFCGSLLTGGAGLGFWQHLELLSEPDRIAIIPTQEKIAFQIRMSLQYVAQHKDYNPQAAYLAGSAYLEGYDTDVLPVDIEKAIKLLENAGDRGYWCAYAVLGDLLRKGWYDGETELLPDGNRAISYYMKAIAHKDPDAYYGWAKLAPKLKKRAELYEKAKETGHLKAVSAKGLSIEQVVWLKNIYALNATQDIGQDGDLVNQLLYTHFQLPWLVKSEGFNPDSTDFIHKEGEHSSYISRLKISSNILKGSQPVQLTFSKQSIDRVSSDMSHLLQSDPTLVFGVGGIESRVPDPTDHQLYELFQQVKTLGLSPKFLVIIGELAGGLPKAKYQLAKFLLRQPAEALGLPRSTLRSEAKNLLEQAAAAGHLKALVWLARLGERQSMQTMTALRAAAITGIAQAQYLWGFYHFLYNEPREALQWIEKAAAQSYRPAQRWMRTFVFPQWVNRMTLAYLMECWNGRKVKGWYDAVTENLFTSYPQLQHWGPLMHAVKALSSDRGIRKAFQEAVGSPPRLEEGLKILNSVLTAYKKLEPYCEEDAQLINLLYYLAIERGDAPKAMAQLVSRAKEGHHGAWILAAAYTEERTILDVRMLEYLEEAKACGHMMGAMELSRAYRKVAFLFGGLDKLKIDYDDSDHSILMTTDAMTGQSVCAPLKSSCFEGRAIPDSMTTEGYWEKILVEIATYLNRGAAEKDDQEIAWQGLLRKAAELKDSRIFISIVEHWPDAKNARPLAESTLPIYYDAFRLCKIHGPTLGCELIAIGQKIERVIVNMKDPFYQLSLFFPELFVGPNVYRSKDQANWVTQQLHRAKTMTEEGLGVWKKTIEAGYGGKELSKIGKLPEKYLSQQQFLEWEQRRACIQDKN